MRAKLQYFWTKLLKKITFFTLIVHHLDHNGLLITGGGPGGGTDDIAVPHRINADLARMINCAILYDNTMGQGEGQINLGK